MQESEFEPVDLAPHSQDAEEAALGSVLINPDAYTELAALLQKDDFFILRHSWIYEAMTRLHERGDILDYLTVIEELRTQGRLADIGGAAYITYLSSNIATSVHADAYARIVHTAAMRRRLLKAASEIAEHAREEDSDLNEALASAQKSLDLVTARSVSHDWQHVEDIASDYFDVIEERFNNKGQRIFGILSGLKDFDAKIRGFHPGRLYIIAARPGVGKTWLMLHLALQAAQQGQRVGIVSMEMNKEELIGRLISLMTRINSLKIDEGDLNEVEWKTFVDAMARFKQLDIFIDDSGFQTPRSLRAKCKRLNARYGIDILFVDYLQLGNADERSTDYERVSAFSRVCANLSKSDALNIPVIATAQLSRAVEGRTDKRPMLFDLRESGQIEQDASVVVFMYRDILYNPQTDSPYVCELGIAKNRFNGGKNGLGVCKVFYDLDTPRFADIATTAARGGGA